MKTYLAKFDPNKDAGVFAISLVKAPAMEGNFIALSKQTEIKLATINEEKRILIGLVLEPNKPIFRSDPERGEFNLMFEEETITQLSHAFFRNKLQSNSTIEHSGKFIDKVTFVESWIVENSKIDKSANYGFEYPKGSWLVSMKVDNDEIWNDYVKSGKVQGFSIDALVELELVNLNTEIQMNEQSILEAIKVGLKDFLVGFKKEPVQLAEIKTGDVTISYEGDELKEGTVVFVINEDGERVSLPVGEYPLEDGSILVVEQEGIVAMIKPMETPQEPEAPVEQSTEKLTEDIVNTVKSILVKYSEEHKAELTELKKQITELSNQPASKPIKSTPVQVDLSKMTAFEKFRNNNLKK
jgi:hypothetical protein